MAGLRSLVKPLIISIITVGRINQTYVHITEQNCCKTGFVNQKAYTNIMCVIPHLNKGAVYSNTCCLLATRWELIQFFNLIIDFDFYLLN